MGRKSCFALIKPKPAQSRLLFLWLPMFKFIVIFLMLVSPVFGDDLYKARELINENKHEEALAILKTLKPSDEVLFYLGVTYDATLDNEMALGCFSLFLESDCEIERLRDAANRRLIELLLIKKGELSDVHQRMEYSSRKLTIRDTGKETQTQQAEILKMLENMIKEEEKKEASSSNKNNIKEQQQTQKESQENKSEKIVEKSNKGGKSDQPNGQVERNYADGPQSPWSRLRERSRDPAFNAIKEKLPPRYRDIVERYYEKVNDPDR